MEMCLDGLQLNNWATVVRINAPETLSCRLRACGIIPGHPQQGRAKCDEYAGNQCVLHEGIAQIFR